MLEIPFISSAILLALVPFVFVLMTSFTRVSIILTFLKQALSTSIPSTQIIIGLSLILTGYIMHPVFKEIYDQAVIPYIHKETKEPEELLKKAWAPLRNFMLYNTREKDLDLFLEFAKVTITDNNISQVPWFCIVPAFVLSELRIAFMLGFILFLPFLIIDMVATSLLMSMGMILLPPVMISFPFKILLFVVVDGWQLVIQQILGGYR